MVKSTFVFILFVLSAFLLTIELIALQMLIKQAKIEEPTAWKILDALTAATEHYKIPLFVIDELILENIQNGVYLQDIDEQIQKRLENHLNKKKTKVIRNKLNDYDISSLISKDCRIFCSTNSKITHLATLVDFVSLETLKLLKNYLKNHHDLTTILIEDVDPSLLHLNLHVNIPTHIIVVDEKVDIRKESHVIHVTVFHEKIRGNYWWQAGLKMNEFQKRLLHRQGLKYSELRLPQSSHIFPKTEILRTTIDGLPIFLPFPPKTFIEPKNEKTFIECDLKRSAEFYQEFPKNDSFEANKFRNQAQNILSKIQHLLDKELQIPFWLSSGTLLGYYRQCDFIVYSSDVDIGIWAQDFRPELIEIFSTNNLPLIHWFGRPNDSLELSFLNEDIKLDIFFFYREKDHYWNGGTQAKSGLKFKYDFPKFTLCWTEFYGILVRIPCETEPYIKANYGENWMTPVTSWDWKSSPPNVRPNGQWQSDEWEETIRLIPIPIF